MKQVKHPKEHGTVIAIREQQGGIIVALVQLDDMPIEADNPLPFDESAEPETTVILVSDQHKTGANALKVGDRVKLWRKRSYHERYNYRKVGE
jgi:hypothetical protein